MNLDVTAINYAGVAVATLATFFLGAVWYTVLFGAMWRRAHGYTEERLREMQGKRPPAVFFSLLLLCYAILALIVAALVALFKIDDAATGAALGFVLWITAAAIQMTGHVSSDRNGAAYLIDVGYQFLYLIMMGALLGVWH